MVIAAERHTAARCHLAGFTLVELLVALFALSLLAVMGWRGLDAMVRTQSTLQARADEALALQVGLAQWRADLDAAVTLPGQPTVQWDGQVLRLVRRADAGSGLEGDGVVVAAWTRRAGADGSLWRRWQSLPMTQRQELQAAWQQAGLWARNPGESERARETAVLPLDDWRVYFYRNDAWTHPQSSDAPGTTAGASSRQGGSGTPGGSGGSSGSGASGTDGGTGSGSGRAATTGYSLPEGVRIVLLLPAGQPVAGSLTLDWVSPRLSGGPS